MEFELSAGRGHVFIFDLPLQTSMRDLLPTVASRIAEQTKDEYFLPKVSDNRLIWGLRNTTKGFVYQAHETLEDRFTEKGDALQLYRHSLQRVVIKKHHPCSECRSSKPRPGYRQDTCCAKVALVRRYHTFQSNTQVESASIRLRKS